MVECPTGSGRKMNLCIRLRGGNFPPPGQHLPERRGRPPAVNGGEQKLQDDPLWTRLPPVLRVFPGRQRCRARREPPDGLDRLDRPRPCICSPPPRRNRFSSWAKPPPSLTSSRRKKTTEAACIE
jgi:hypothetical protein